MSPPMSSEIQDYLSITFQEEERLLQAAWLRSVDSGEYRKGVALLKDMVVEKQAAFLLADSRRLSSITFADQQWIIRDIAPTLVASGLQKFARVLTEDVFNYITFENLLQRITENHRAGVEVAQFTSVEAALDWLRMD